MTDIGRTRAFFDKQIQLGDISDYSENESLFYILVAAILVDTIVLAIVRSRPDRVGIAVNDWYDRFSLSAVLADVLILVIGVLLARYIYTSWLAPFYGFNPWIFTALAIGIQLLHDILFYIGVIRTTPYGENEMIDVFKNYAKENGGMILLADAGMIVGTVIGAMLLKEMPLHISMTGVIVALYTIQYYLFKIPKV